MLTHDALMEYAGIPLEKENIHLRATFDEAMRRMPADLPWLDEAFIKESAEFYSLDEKTLALYRTSASKIKANENMRQLFWLFYYTIYEGPQPLFHSWFWPFPEKTVDVIGSRFFPNVVLLSGAGVHKRMIASTTVPEKILKQHMKSVSHTVRAEFGALMGMLGPCALHQKGRQFILGRLNYEMGESEISKFMFLKNNKTGEIVLIATEGRYRPDGFFLAEENEEGFDAAYTVSTDRYIAHPVHPEGYIMKNTYDFLYEDWYSPFPLPCETQHVHIPAKKPFTMDLIMRSLKYYRRFIKKHFPTFQPKIIFCDSWLLSPQIADCLKDDSNIMRFMRKFYLFPNNLEKFGIYYFLFHDADCKDDKLLAEDTSLQRKVKAKLLAGERVETSCGFMLWDDWDKPEGYYYEQEFFKKFK